MRIFLILLLTACLANAAELRVNCQYPESSKHLHGNAVYPDFVFDMSDASGWKNFGSIEGHLLKQYPAPFPDDPARKGLLFSCRMTTKNAKAPGWVGWQYNLDPDLNIVGANEVELDIYPFQKYDFPITARFGSHKGFGILPCTWSDIVLKLEPNRWNTVRIPIKKSRPSTDTLRFDFNTRNPKIEHQKEYKMLIGAIRFAPAPEEPLAVHSAKITGTPPIVNGLLLNHGAAELTDGNKLSYQMELQLTEPLEGVLQLTNGTETLRKEVSLKPPFTVIEVEIDNAAAFFGKGKQEIRSVILDKDNKQLASLERPLKVECFSTPEMESRRQELLGKLVTLEKQREALAAAGIPAEIPAISLTAARLFLDHFVLDDFNRQKQFRIANEELDDVADILKRAETELTAYRTKQITESAVTPYDPALPLQIKNGVICQSGRPILLVGPLAGMPAVDWSVYASRLGFNSLVVETNMDYWLNIGNGRKKVISGFSDLFQTPVKYTGEHTRLDEYLKLARENKLAANLLLSSHYCKNLPSDLKAARDPSSTHGNFDWNVLAPEAKEAFRRMYANIMPYLENNPQLISLGTANEPGYQVTDKSTDFQRGFIVYLNEKYSNVDELNKAWKSNYSSLDAIDLKSVFKLAESSSGAKVDWDAFVSLQVSSFYGFLRDTLLASLPEKQIWVKLMGGMGYEMLDEEENIGLGQNVSGTDHSEPMWLDHLRSLYPGLPVVNQEWHFVRAGYTSNAAFLANRMFLGVTRGMQSATIWRGIRADWNSKNHGHVESFSRYPFALESIGRTAYRMRMLYPVLVRLQQLDGGGVRLYYDKKAHLIRGNDYVKTLTECYEKLRINPQGARFVYPNRLEQLENVRLIAAGALRDIPAESAQKLEKWVAAGGTLWLAAPCTWNDYYGQQPELPAAFAKALSASGVTRYGQGAVVTASDWTGYRAFFTGPVTDDDRVECRVLTTPDGKPEYIALVNLENAPRKVRLQGQSGTVDDLWNNTRVKLSDEMELAPFEVKLLKLR